MSPDVQKAAASLAAGRRDEALVYAWNSLSSAQGDDLAVLRSLAEKLDDPLLLLELDRRGLPALPVRQSSADLPAKRRRGALIGSFVFAGVVVAILALVVSQIPVEPGPLHARPTDTVEFTKVRRILTVGTGVYLVPLGKVRRVDVAALAAEVGRRYRVPTGTLPPVAIPIWTFDPGERALNGDQLIRLLQLTYPAQGHAAVIGITHIDMFS